MMVRRDSLFWRRTCMVCSQQLRITPSTPVQCMPGFTSHQHSNQVRQATFSSLHKLQCGQHFVRKRVQLLLQIVNTGTHQKKYRVSKHACMQLRWMHACRPNDSVGTAAQEQHDKPYTHALVLQQAAHMKQAPVAPMPSTMLLVRRKGTSSGVFRKRPCSKATPRSMCTTSAVLRSSRMLWLCRSPKPMM